MRVFNIALAVAALAAHGATTIPYCEAQPAKAKIADPDTIALAPIFLQNMAGRSITITLNDKSCARQTPTWFECGFNLSNLSPTIGPSNTPMNFTPQFAVVVGGRGSGFVETVIQVTGITNKVLSLSIGLPLGWAKASQLGPSWWYTGQYIIFGTLTTP